MKKKRKAREFIYALVGMLLVVGAISVAAAKETTSVYDAPDLHLTRGSESYDLTEGITYDSDKYDLAVKDTGDFDINTVGEYEVGYTLTPKVGEAEGQKETTPEEQKETTPEEQKNIALEGDGVAQSTDGEAAVQNETAEQSSEEETATVQSDKEDGAAIQPVEGSEAAGDKDEAKESGDAPESGDAETEEGENSQEETILFKRTVCVESEDGYYLYAPALETETGTTQYNLLDGVELRNSEDNTKVEEAILKVNETDLSALKEKAMTEEEVRTFIEEMEMKGEEPEAAKEVAVMSSEGGEESMPALKAGVYDVEIQALDEKTGETYTARRDLIVRTVRRDHAMKFQIMAYSKRFTQEKQAGEISQLGTELDLDSKYKGFQSGKSKVPTEVPTDYLTDMIYTQNERGNWQRTYQYKVNPLSLVGKLGGRSEYEIFRSFAKGGKLFFIEKPDNWWYAAPMPRTDSSVIYGTRGNGGDTTSSSGSYTGYYVIKDATPSKQGSATIRRANWNNLIGGGRDKATMKEGGDADVKVTPLNSSVLTTDELNFNVMCRYTDGIDQNSSISILGQKEDGSSVTLKAGTYVIPRAMQVELKDFKQSYDTTNFTAPTFSLVNKAYLRLNNLYSDKGEGKEGSKAIKVTGTGEIEAWSAKDTENNALMDLMGKTITIFAKDQNMMTPWVNNNTPYSKAENVNIRTNGKVIVGYGVSTQSNKSAKGQSNVKTLTLDGQGEYVMVNQLTGLDNGTTAKCNIVDDVVLTSDVGVVASTANSTIDATLTVKNSLTSNGYKIRASINQTTAPEDKALFAKIDGDGKVLDPTDFTAGTTDTRYWTNEKKNWYMTNGDDNQKIVFRKLSEDGKEFTPIVVKGTEDKSADGEYVSYEKALQKIGESKVTGTYTITNKVAVNFTQEDATALKGLVNAEGKKLIFKGGEEDVEKYGAATYGNTYHVRVRHAVLEIPEGVDVTFDVIIKYDEGTQADEHGGKQMIFISNGDELNFEQNVEFKGADGGDAQRPLVYAGGNQTDAKNDSTLNIKSGGFQSVYGGNYKSDSSTKNADITISGTATIADTLNGGSDGETGETAKTEGRTANITINELTSKDQTLSVQNVYNYDKLSVNGNLTVTNELNSENKAGYQGETILGGETTTTLSKADGIKKIGSLKIADKAAKNANLVLERAADDGDKTASSNENKNILTLTAVTSLGEVKQETNKITVRYVNKDKETDGDIIFYLPNTEKADVVTTPFESGFKFVLKAQPSDKTIRIYTSSVRLMDEDANKGANYISIEEAIDALAEWEWDKETSAGKKHTYTIAFLKDYSVDAHLEDLRTMQDVMDDTSERSKARTAKQITWCANIDAEGKTTNNIKTVTLSQDLELFGTDSTDGTDRTKNVLENITFNGTGTDAYTIYAGGTDLTVKENVTLNGTAPNVNGGSKVDTDNPDGSDEGENTDDTTKSKPENSISVLQTIPLNDVKDFKTLTIGTGETENKVTLTISGELNSNSKLKADEKSRTDTVSLKNAELKLTGTTQGHIGNLNADANSNTINIHKDAEGIKTLNLDGNVILSNANKKITLAMNGTEATLRDVLLLFADAGNAKAEQYTGNLKYNIIKDGNQIKLDINSAKMLLTSDSVAGGINTLVGKKGTDTLYGYSKYNPKTKAFDLPADWKNFSNKQHDGLQGDMDDPQVKVTLLQNVNQSDLDFINIKPFNGTENIKNVTNTSSLLVEGAGKMITTRASNTSASINYQVNSMEIEFRNIIFNNLSSTKKNTSLGTDYDATANKTTWELMGSTYFKFNDVTTNSQDQNSTILQITGGGIKEPNSTLEIVGSKKAASVGYNPAFYTGSFSKTIVRTNGQDIKKPMKINSVANTGDDSERVSLYTNGKDIYYQRIHVGGLGESSSIYSDIGLYGEGRIVFSNRTQIIVEKEEYTERNKYGKKRGQLTAKNLILHDGNTGIVRSGNMNDADSNLLLWGEVISNGYQIIADLNENLDTQDGMRYQLKDGRLFAVTMLETKLLDPTDFTVPVSKKGTWYMLHPNSTDGNRRIVFRKPENSFKPIMVTKNGTEKGEYFTYAEAFKAIEKESGTDTYTITNKISMEFTKDDADILKSLQNVAGKTLIFEGGKENKALYGSATYGSTYHVRMRRATMEMPKGVNVTFKNITLKYDEGTQAEKHGGTQLVFVGNGNNLIFEKGVTFRGADGGDTMKATVYGGSITDKLTANSTVEIHSGNFAAVYGAGTKAQTGNATVIISADASDLKIDKIFGGGSGAEGKVKGNVTVLDNAILDVLYVSSEGVKCRSIYGGGEGADVEGNISVTVRSGMKNESIYGGGKGAKVTGDTNVTVKVDNTYRGQEQYMDTVSGTGTDAEGNLEENVTGTKKIQMSMVNGKSGWGTVKLKRITGFDELTLGDNETTAYNSSIFQVSERFDSEAVDPTDANAERNGKVILKDSTLNLNGNYKGQIGSLEVKGNSALGIYKVSTNNTKPLQVYGTMTLEDASKKLRINAIKNGAVDNELKDVILQFTNVKNAVAENYIDGSNNNLPVDRNHAEILFKDSKVHDVGLSYVEYPMSGNQDEGTITVELDKNTTKEGESNNKILHFDYSADNEHGVRTEEEKGGYVIRIKKTDIKEDADSKKEQLKYTMTDDGFAEDGNFSSSFTFTKGTDYWPITFTKDTHEVEMPDGNKVEMTTYEGQTKEIPIDNDTYWYIAHVVCEKGDTTTFLVDTGAPKQQSGAEYISVENTELDTSGDAAYEYTFTVKDRTTVELTENTPYDKNGKHMNYLANGIRDVVWTVGDATGNKNAEVDASINGGMSVDLAGDRIKGFGIATPLEDDTVTGVDQGNVAKVKLTVPKSVIDAAKEKAQYIWVYVKDNVNNTVKLAIPVNENVIDVKVPLKVNVVAVKKADGGDCELLAPTCYVVNNGEKTIKAEVNGFKTTIESDALKLSEDKASYTASEIALQLIPESGDNADKKTNVLSINKNPLSIGTMEGANSINGEKNLKYTFDAAYNVKEINVPNKMISNTMSYHFTVEK